MLKASLFFLVLLLPFAASAQFSCLFGGCESESQFVDNRGITNLYAQPKQFELFDILNGRSGYCLSTDGVYTYETIGCAPWMAKESVQNCRNANSWHPGSGNLSKQCHFVKCVGLKKAIKYCTERDRQNPPDFRQLRDGVQSGSGSSDENRPLTPGELCRDGSCTCSNGTLTPAGTTCN